MDEHLKLKISKCACGENMEVLRIEKEYSAPILRINIWSKCKACGIVTEYEYGFEVQNG